MKFNKVLKNICFVWFIWFTYRHFVSHTCRSCEGWTIWLTIMLWCNFVIGWRWSDIAVEMRVHMACEYIVILHLWTILLMTIYETFLIGQFHCSCYTVYLMWCITQLSPPVITSNASDLFPCVLTMWYFDLANEQFLYKLVYNNLY